MKKVTITNSFHNTQVTVVSDASTGREAWEQIVGEAFGANHPTPADKAKYRRVMKALCGIDGCQCGSHIG